MLKETGTESEGSKARSARGERWGCYFFAATGPQKRLRAPSLECWYTSKLDCIWNTFICSQALDFHTPSLASTGHCGYYLKWEGVLPKVGNAWHCRKLRDKRSIFFWLDFDLHTNLSWTYLVSTMFTLASLKSPWTLYLASTREWTA